MGKKEFYPLAAEAFQQNGYKYFDGDKDIRGKGRSHACKPDFIAVKGNTVVIGEIKSPDEGPKTSSWRVVQNSDSENFRDVRQNVFKREASGVLSREIGGHEIIIRGQIPDYVAKIGITFDLPEEVPGNGMIKRGYTLPVTEVNNVEAAFASLHIDYVKMTYLDLVCYIFG